MVSTQTNIEYEGASVLYSMLHLSLDIELHPDTALLSYRHWHNRAYPHNKETNP